MTDLATYIYMSLLLMSALTSGLIGWHRGAKLRPLSSSHPTPELEPPLPHTAELTADEYEILGYKDTDDLLARLDDVLMTPEEKLQAKIDHYDIRHGRRWNGTIYACCVNPTDPRDPKDYPYPDACCSDADWRSTLSMYGRTATQYKACAQHPDYESRRVVSYDYEKLPPCGHNGAKEWKIVGPGGVSRRERTCHLCDTVTNSEWSQQTCDHANDDLVEREISPGYILNTYRRCGHIYHSADDPLMKKPDPKPRIAEEVACCQYARRITYNGKAYYELCDKHNKPVTINDPTTGEYLGTYRPASEPKPVVHWDGSMLTDVSSTYEAELRKQKQNVPFIPKLPVACQHLDFRSYQSRHGDILHVRCNTCLRTLPGSHDPQTYESMDFMGYVNRTYVQCPCGCVR